MGKTFAPCRSPYTLLSTHVSNKFRNADKYLREIKYKNLEYTVSVLDIITASNCSNCKTSLKASFSSLTSLDSLRVPFSTRRWEVC